MAPLFFALAAASSESGGGSGADRLALLPGVGGGWLSARCCEYPQELLLQLERSAEVHEVELSVPGDCPASEVEVHLSRGLEPVSLAGDLPFDHVATLRFEPGEPGREGPPRRYARARLGLSPCSGQVRVLLREPAPDPGNPYGQVGILSLELWGHEDVAAPGAGLAGARPDEGGALSARGAPTVGEMMGVLVELGIPLDAIPFDEDMLRSGDVDADTSRLLGELRRRQRPLVRAGRTGDAQQLEERVQQLAALGVELKRLRAERENMLTVGDPDQASKLLPRIRGLEQFRLQVAAFYETDWWLERMALPPGALGGGG